MLTLRIKGGFDYLKEFIGIAKAFCVYLHDQAVLLHSSPLKQLASPVRAQQTDEHRGVAITGDRWGHPIECVREVHLWRGMAE